MSLGEMQRLANANLREGWVVETEPCPEGDGFQVYLVLRATGDRVALAFTDGASAPLSGRRMLVSERYSDGELRALIADLTEGVRF